MGFLSFMKKKEAPPPSEALFSLPKASEMERRIKVERTKEAVEGSQQMGGGTLSELPDSPLFSSEPMQKRSLFGWKKEPMMPAGAFALQPQLTNHRTTFVKMHAYKQILGLLDDCGSCLLRLDTATDAVEHLKEQKLQTFERLHGQLQVAHTKLQQMDKTLFTRR